MVQMWAVQLTSYFLSFLTCQMGKINGTFLYGVLGGLNENEMLQGKPWTQMLTLIRYIASVSYYYHYYPSIHLSIQPSMHAFQPLQQFLQFGSPLGRDARAEKQGLNRRGDYITINQGPFASQTSVMLTPSGFVLPWQATYTYFTEGHTEMMSL